ncbi:hypothetical protein CCP4SC76_6450002 [Gammaproteobacteria bacterium]
METILKAGGTESLDTGSQPSQNQKHNTLYAPEMLTPSELDWLKRDAKEASEKMVRRYHEIKKRNNLHP